MHSNTPKPVSAQEASAKPITLKGYRRMEWDQKVMRSGQLKTKTEICVVSALLAHFNTEGEAWPSMDAIAKMALCNRNNATTAVKRLVALKFLTEYPPGRNGRRTKTYRMALPPNLAKSNVVQLQTFIRPKREG
jgi:Helix-turn-helix domain